jgi:hypothetical protein
MSSKVSIGLLKEKVVSNKIKGKNRWESSLLTDASMHARKGGS